MSGNQVLGHDDDSAAAVLRAEWNCYSHSSRGYSGSSTW